MGSRKRFREHLSAVKPRVAVEPQDRVVNEAGGYVHAVGLVEEHAAGAVLCA